MARRLVLHIGVRKSGTSYLQYALSQSGAALAPLGATYPAPYPRGVDVAGHERATYGFLADEFPWLAADFAQAQQPAWRALVEQTAAAPGLAIVSAEALCVIRRPAIEPVLAALGVDDVQVLITARDLGGLLASTWQQHVRNGQPYTAERYLSELARDRTQEDLETALMRPAWRGLALGPLVERWASVVGLDRVTLVTSPGSPPETLWKRFAAAAGIPDLGAVPPPTMSAVKAHTGLTAPEIEFLAVLNDGLARSALDPVVVRRIRNRAIVHGFIARPERGPKAALPLDWQERVAAWSREDVTRLEQTGVRVVGSLDELRYEAGVKSPPVVTAADVARAGSAAVLAVAGLLPPPAPASGPAATKPAPAPAAPQLGARRSAPERVRSLVGRAARGAHSRLSRR